MKTKVIVQDLSEFQQVAKRIVMKLDVKSIVVSFPIIIEFYSPDHTGQDSEFEEMLFENFKEIYIP